MCSTIKRQKPDGCRKRKCKISSRTSRCPAPTLLSFFCFGLYRAHSVGRSTLLVARLATRACLCWCQQSCVLLRVSLSVAQVLRSQKTKLIEDLKQAIKLATEAEAGGGASAALPPKKRAAAVEGPATGARALGAAHSDKPRGAHPGALNKRRRLAQQAPAGCEIAAAGCWERGDERAEALEWQI